MKKVTGITFALIFTCSLAVGQAGNVKVTDYGNFSVGTPDLSARNNQIALTFDGNFPFVEFPIQGPGTPYTINDVKTPPSLYGPSHAEVISDTDFHVLAFIDYDQNGNKYDAHVTFTGDTGNTWSNMIYFDSIVHGNWITTTNPNPVLKAAGGDLFMATQSFMGADSGALLIHRLGARGFYYPFGEIAPVPLNYDKIMNPWSYDVKQQQGSRWHAVAWFEDFSTDLLFSLHTADAQTAWNDPDTVWKVDTNVFQFVNVHGIDIAINDEGQVAMTWSAWMEDMNFNSVERIFVAVSRDGGSTWSIDSIPGIAQPAPGSSRVFWRSSGEVIITYRRGQHLYTVSTNDPVLFGRTRQITDSASAAGYDAVVHNDVLCIAWEDGRAGFGLEEIYYDTIHTEALPLINDPPLAVNDTVSTGEDTAVAVMVLGNDSDPNLDPLEIVSTGVGGNGNNTTQGGTSSINANGTPADKTDDYIDYTPALDYFGQDTFSYVIKDTVEAFDTATVFVTVRKAVGVHEFQSAILLYPNPANDFLFLQWTKEMHAVQITSMDGKTSQTVNISGLRSKSIDVSDLASGIYIVSLLDSQGLIDNFGTLSIQR